MQLFLGLITYMRNNITLDLILTFVENLKSATIFCLVEEDPTILRVNK